MYGEDQSPQIVSEVTQIMKINKIQGNTTVNIGAYGCSLLVSLIKTLHFLQYLI